MCAIVTPEMISKLKNLKNTKNEETSKKENVDITSY